MEVGDNGSLRHARLVAPRGVVRHSGRGGCDHPIRSSSAENSGDKSRRAGEKAQSSYNRMHLKWLQSEHRTYDSLVVPLPGRLRRRIVGRCCVKCWSHSSFLLLFCNATRAGLCGRARNDIH